MSVSSFAPLGMRGRDLTPAPFRSRSQESRAVTARFSFVRAESAFPSGDVTRSRAARASMRPTDFCTPKQLKTRIPVTSSSPGAALQRVCLSAIPGGAHDSEAFASCSLAWCRSARCARVRRLESGHREARGRSMQVRPGKVAFHDATLTSVIVDAWRAA